MYGLDPLDFEAIDKKLDFQKAFIENKFFDFDFAENKSAIDFTYSANLNPNKYFAEMNNRINSIFQYSKKLDLMPVFCTITAPSKYHQTDKNRKLIYSPNDTAKALTQIFNKFTNLQVFQRMKRETKHGLIYFRVYEPHKSGVPHCHIMLFLPKNYILEVKNKFFEYFTNAEKWGNNKKSLDFRYTFYNVNGAISYIMKYVTKTFKNENDTTNKAWYWYIKNRIRRFLTSRTLAPLEIYRKVRYFFKNLPNDYLYVTNLVKNNQIIKLFEKTTFNYMRFNIETGEIEDVTLWQKSAELILNSRIKTNQTFTLKYTPKLHNKALTVFVSEFVKYSFSDKLNKFVIVPVIPAMLKDYQLNKYYDLLIKDLDNIDLVHFGVVKNEMIKRGFLHEFHDVYINPKLYNSDFLTVD
ncbi:replication endonuclease [Aliarcobacter cryaerophilus]|uniref:replication endonuclease n=1 Tax=Aliarcobacter cryaerophilus TaxID=28198 RepID=UPI0021B27785|nr:replication endonuclease [Aliarcobacter cryaerophilus]MCT7487466.1 replication endonuclease [Aliarcobacter cryaerophilus]MCT7487475.1 replication endonuclease [Aliarcobacter cryaerophilus]